MPDGPRSENQGDGPGRDRLISVVATASLALTTIVSLFLTLSDRIAYSTVSVQAIFIVLGAILYLVATIFLLRYLRRVRYRSARIALTGLPTAGKTVFSVGLFDSLMSERADGIGFTAESRTVISVYQALRGIDHGTWPASTSKDVVNRYEGKIQFRRRRTVLDVEVGDSAGEYWAEFPLDETRDQDYLSYVSSSDGVLHVIAIDWLTGEATPPWPRGNPQPYDIRTDIDDLLLAARLARPQEDGGKKVPLLIVISKMDIYDFGGSPEMFRLFHADGIQASEALSIIDLGRDANVRRKLAEASSALAGEYSSVTFCLSAVSPNRRKPPLREEISMWLYDVALRGTRESTLHRLLGR